MSSQRADAVRAALTASAEDPAPTHLLITHQPNVRWLTGFTGSAGCALVVPGGPVTLVTDNRYTLRARQEAPDADLVIDRTWGWLPDLIADARLGVEADTMSWATVTRLQELLDDADGGVEVVPTSGIIAHLRAVKEVDEIATIREACAVTTAAFEDLLEWISPGVTERQVERFLGDVMRDRGATDHAFPAIVASGPNGAIPHHSPGSRVIRAGDLVTVDFGALLDGMHADMTRTFAVGEPTPQMRQIHDLVRAAQQAGVDAATAGADTAAVDRACRTLIASAGHGDDFVHGTGHGVGLEVHEEPFLGAQTPGTLRPQMTVTVEPGVYLPDVGGVRIEDVVLITNGPAQRLTTAPRELIVV